MPHNCTYTIYYLLLSIDYLFTGNCEHEHTSRFPSGGSSNTLGFWGRRRGGGLVPVGVRSSAAHLTETRSTWFQPAEAESFGRTSPPESNISGLALASLGRSRTIQHRTPRGLCGFRDVYSLRGFLNILWTLDLRAIGPQSHCIDAAL